MTKRRWSRRVPRRPGLYWTAILLDGVQYTTLRRISMRPDDARRGRLGLALSPGLCMGMEPLEIAIQASKETERYWLAADGDVPMMPAATEIDT